MKKIVLVVLALMLMLLLISCGASSPSEPDNPSDETTGGNGSEGDKEGDGGSSGIDCPHSKVGVLEAVEATCQKEGLSEGSYCRGCGITLVKQEKTPKAPHKEVPTEEIKPTCTELGYAGGTHCSVCKEVIEEATPVSRIDHTEVENEYVAPTCTEYGSKGGTHCSVCGKDIKSPTTLPKTSHTEVANEDREATCAEAGIIGGTSCSVCGAVIVEGEEIPALPHTEINLPGYEATCGKTGLSEGKYCTVCKQTTVKQTVIPKTTHKLLITEAVVPTCYSVGYTEGSECRFCGEIVSERVEIPKKAHTIVIDKAVTATCANDGLTEGSHCSICDEVIVAQEIVSKNTSSHVYDNFATVSKSPSFSSSGSGTIKCSKCGNTQSITFSKLTASKLTEDDIYSIETDQYNPAYDNRWKVIDGSTSTAGLWSPGGEWFGNVGDVLVITLKQEMTLTDLTVYLTGNSTYGTIRVKDSAGNTTITKNVNINGGDAYGGSSKAVSIASGTSKKAYTIEIEVTGLKWESAMTFKVAEVEITAAPNDTRISHTHDYREFFGNVRAATCQQTGIEAYDCFCGHRKEIETAKADHMYETLKSSVAPTCTQNGEKVYSCDCGTTKTTIIEAKGHVYEKLIKYNVVPTVSSSGNATYKCVGCSSTQNKELSPLPVEKLYYLRVASIGNDKAILKLNVYGDLPSLEVRYSESVITEENYSSAKIIDAIIEGERQITLTISLDASLDKCYYVAIKPYSGTNYGEMVTVRVGGSGEIPIDYSKAQVYSGEVLNSFRPLFDDDITTKLGLIFADSGDTAELYGSNLSPIIDFEYIHYIKSLKLYYADADVKATVRWSDIPLDFQSENSLWDGSYELTSVSGWNEVSINSKARYVQIIFVDGSAPYEVEAYGYQCGEGDEITTSDKKEYPLLGNMIGMCGFVAAGGGHTPIENVSAAGVLREYHNFGWSYDASKYGKLANNFTTTWMGNFDYEYRVYREAGINVIPCIQWALGNGETISYKVGSDNLPLYSSGSLIKSTFWERFNPHTYFVFADHFFAFAARYGSNSSSYLYEVMKSHCSDAPSVGQGTVEWIEMGNEPDGNWNGIHNYLSAYQLAAATSAAYDGHCRTMVTDSGAYHLGGKNADSSIKLALAGVSGVSNEYIMALCYWMKANRPDGSVAFDAFNVHHYMTKAIELPNGSTAYVGISPEEANLAGILSELIGIRDKYYPDKEVWITEFGWDTNQSYATSTSCHAYGEYTGRQVQAMWLTRAYLLLSGIGIDKADMYMAHDTGVEATSVGKYNTCGVIAYEYDENGEKVQVKKDSYYYMYTLKNTLGGYRFDSVVESYDENVMVYKYVTDEGKTAYALWCKTSDGTKVDNYQLAIDGSSATRVRNEYGYTEGLRQTIFADEYGYVSVNVSENPIYVVVD
ncbi:MAG: hypothetical protein IJW54_01360 [Clostridia bacterium]|nr:hypothetical protein [Clostridia bacterium]